MRLPWQMLTAIRGKFVTGVTIEKQGLESWRDDKESADFD
jgi:hypothetical protein